MKIFKKEKHFWIDRCTLVREILCPCGTLQIIEHPHLKEYYKKTKKEKAK